MRTQRREVAADIDSDGDERISREEFAALFKTGRTAAEIDVAPESAPIPAFVEAAKLPKLP